MNLYTFLDHLYFSLTIHTFLQPFVPFLNSFSDHLYLSLTIHTFINQFVPFFDDLYLPVTIFLKHLYLSSLVGCTGQGVRYKPILNKEFFQVTPANPKIVRMGVG